MSANTLSTDLFDNIFKNNLKKYVFTTNSGKIKMFWVKKEFSYVQFFIRSLWYKMRNVILWSVEPIIFGHVELRKMDALVGQKRKGK